MPAIYLFPGSDNDGSDVLSGGAPSSEACPLEFPCLPADLRSMLGHECERLVVHYPDPLPKGTRIFGEGQEFTGLFAIRSGCVKKYHLMSDGQEQIVGFFFRGDILGLSGVGGDAYLMTAQTLDTTSVCEIPFENLEHLAHTRPEVRRKLYELLHQQFVAEKRLQSILRMPSSESRVAAFLVYLSEHFSNRRLSRTRLHLPMTRRDIANYLGLTVETVSRTFSQFAKSEILKVENRDVGITQPERLQQIAGVCFF